MSDDKASFGKGSLYHCDYCRKDITQLIRIRCAQCADFDLCLECFSSGQQVDQHLHGHPYRVVEYVKTPIFDPQWGADEELALLEAIEQFGFGNWSDIADHVGTKSKTECEAHYDQIYLSHSSLIPDPQHSLFDDAGKPRDVKVDRPAFNPMQYPKNPLPNKPKPKSGLGHLVGYIPNRGDFDTEYDNDAELILADMEFKEEDTKWERELKLKVLEIYNSKLDARFERKKFILDRQLLDRKEKKRTKEEREIYNNMRVFARFHSAEEHEQFIQGILNEQRLRRRIEMLQQHRLNGIRTLADGELFEQEKRRRELANQRKTGTAAGTTPAAAAAPALGKGKRPAAEDLGDADRSKVKKELAAGSGVKAAAIGSGFHIDQMEGAELLSEKEKQLCVTLQLVPQHYLAIKEKLVRECFSRGFLKEGTAKQLIKIDVNKTQKLFDFFVSVGWLNTAEPAAPPRPQPAGKQPALTATNPHAQP